MKLFLMIFILFTLFIFNLYSFTEYFDNSWTNTGTNMIYQSPSGVGMNFNMSKIRVRNVNINNTLMHRIIIPEIYGPTEPGKPNFPRISRFIAIPQGANIFVNITGSRKRIFKNITPSPAPESIPYDPNDSLIYKPDSSIYFGYSIYPEEIIHVSKPFKIRGVDIVQVTMEPFQWDPKTKDLTVYTYVSFQVSFTGGNGQIGEDRLRSRFWDRILQCNIVNYQSLDRIDYSKRATEAAVALSEGYPYGAEFVIITPDIPIFISWADSIKKLRTEDGIITEIYTLSEVGNSFDNIESWIDYAYYSWNIPPEGILLLADYNDDDFSEGITSKIFPIIDHGFYTYVSDNYYADVDGDTLPDIAIGRIPVRNSDDLENVVGKLLRYEKNPTDSFSFYNHVLVSGNFYYDSFYDHHVMSEIIKGFYIDSLSKTVIRLYIGSSNPGSFEPGDEWLPNGDNFWLPGLVDYFSSIGYIEPYMTEDFLYSDIWGKDYIDINNTINAGCCMVHNLGHGGVGSNIPIPSHWSQPWYTAGNLEGFDNYNELPYVYALGCWVGKFDDAITHHSEKFMLLSPNASGEGRGAIGVTSASYKGGDANSHFLGDMDYMWKNFDPQYPRGYASMMDTFHEAMPGFALVSGKYYLVCRNSNWKHKFGKYSALRMFQHFGDPYQRLYTELPQEFTDDDIKHYTTISAGATYFTVKSPINSFMTLINEGRIIGRARSYGNPVNIPLVPQEEGTEIELVVTKQNFLRYYDTISVIPTSGVYIKYVEIDTIISVHGNNQINPTGTGDTNTIVLEIVNFGDESSGTINFLFTSNDSNIVIFDTSFSRQFEEYDTVYLSYDFSIVNNPEDKYKIECELNYTDGNGDSLTEQIDLFVNAPVITYEKIIYTPEPRAGDTSDITIVLKNTGSGTAFEPVFTLRTSDSFIILVDSVYETLLDCIKPGERDSFPDILSFYISPYKYDRNIEFEIIVTSDEYYNIIDTLFYYMNSKSFFSEDFEEGSEWSFTGDYCWHVSELDGYSGSHSMYNGDEELYPCVYPNGVTNARAISPELHIIRSSDTIDLYLSYWQRYDIEDGNDGAQVQVRSLSDSIWHVVYPFGGYTGESRGYGGFSEGEAIYTGSGHNIWEEQFCPLDSVNANDTIQICWRFGSNILVTKEGYYLDDIDVYCVQDPNDDNFDKASGNEDSVYIFALNPVTPVITRGRAMISYSVGDEVLVKLVIYDVAGREVSTLVNEVQTAANYKIEWDGRDDHGSMVSSGTYFYRMSAGGFSAGEKLVVVR